MRAIIVKYHGECTACHAALPPGTTAIYERRVGLWCPPRAPTDPEAIRAVRQAAADRKADRYDTWAKNREAAAVATLNHNMRYTSDLAFNTQPGHIPLRARVIAQNDRAYESLNIATQMHEKADRLRHVRVAGDAESKRQAIRDRLRPLLWKGMKIESAIWGQGIIKKINQKTVTVEQTGPFKTSTVGVDIAWIRPLDVYIVKCDDCKAIIKLTPDLQESHEGGCCEICRAKLTQSAQETRS